MDEVPGGADDMPSMKDQEIASPFGSLDKRTFNLSPAHYEYIESLVHSGAYLSGSEVIRAGLRALQERDAAVERWLSEDVASVLDAVQSEQRRTVPAATVFAAVRARYADRRRKPRL
jgi:antitoxin ParD1/3/4